MYADLPEELDGYTDFFLNRNSRVLIAETSFGSALKKIGSARRLAMSSAMSVFALHYGKRLEMPTAGPQTPAGHVMGTPHRKGARD